ncbi:hypothetical protein HOLleu_19146 [Holothuria leucospilota]|uniref:Uncharacterized protein n=1 Tax=Holothuria leucospilota TaxID=206669 RepID=A0A9Q1C4W9_HOLLE|nr:hypothetical protein HOLleu_19146 [Holothuria leucospilota]
MEEFHTTITSTISDVHGNTSSFSLCASINANIPFLIDSDHCTWILVSAVLALFCICLVAVTLFQCRIRLKGEERYTKRLYLPKRPGNKHELKMKGVSEEEGRSFKENKCTRYPPSFELPAVPVAFNISECSSEADVYSECYHTIEENAIKGTIFSEKDVCMMVNLKTGLLYNRWMGTIALSDEHRKCVVFSAVTGLSPKKVFLTIEGICKLYDFCLDEDAGNIVKMKKSQMLEVLITESAEIVSEDSKHGYTPMHKIGDGEKTEVAMSQ